MPEGPLRVLILATQYFPILGGSEVQARLLAREFLRRGDKVEVWTRRLEGSHPKRDTVDGVPIFRLGPIFPFRSPVARRFERVCFVPAVWWRLRRRIREFDGVIATQIQYPALAAILAKGNSGVPVLTRTASSGPESEMRREEWAFRFQRWLLLRNADLMVALGPVTRDECLSAGFPASRVTIVPNGLDLAGLPPPDRKSDSYRVLWLGKFRSEKRPDLAIMAWRQAAVRGTLVLVGDGPGRARVDALIAELAPGVAPSIETPGLVENPWSELAAADVFVQSSDTEGMSNALIEAMAAGCACVATDVGETRHVLGGSEEEVSQGVFREVEAGLLVKPGDVQGLAEAIRALRDPDLRARLGDAARKRCLAVYDIRVAAQRYADLLTQRRSI